MSDELFDAYKARVAFDVMMRRGWYVVPHVSLSGCLWQIRDCGGYDMAPGFEEMGIQGAFPDPFTALVEADKWYAATIEGKLGRKCPT